MSWSPLEFIYISIKWWWPGVRFLILQKKKIILETCKIFIISWPKNFVLNNKIWLIQKKSKWIVLLRTQVQHPSWNPESWAHIFLATLEIEEKNVTEMKRIDSEKHSSIIFYQNLVKWYFKTFYGSWNTEFLS